MTRGTDCLPFRIGIIDSNVFLENIGWADYDFPCQDGTFPELCKAGMMFRRIARTIGLSFQKGQRQINAFAPAWVLIPRLCVLSLQPIQVWRCLWRSNHFQKIGSHCDLLPCPDLAGFSTWDSTSKATAGEGGGSELETRLTPEDDIWLFLVKFLPLCSGYSPTK